MKPEPTNEQPRYHLPAQLIHDLKTPLNHIIGYSEMLVEQARETGQDAFVPDLEKVLGAGQRLLGIVSNSFDGNTATAPPSQGPRYCTAKKHLQGESTEKLVVTPKFGEQEGHLLVVDDEEGNREVLSRLLKKQGFVVANAQDGQQALEMLSAQAYDLVLLDIMMPEVDGYEVLTQLKSDDQLRNIPVIMISALSEMASVARCVELGADDYLSKPFDSTLLKARVGACLEKKRWRDREVQMFQQLQDNYDRLQVLEGLRDDLTHMIIHDLRTPLASIMAAIQTLDVVGEVNPDQREIIDIAMTGAEGLLTTVNTLLDVEKLESGGMNLNISLLSVSEVVASAIGQVAPLAESKHLMLVQDLGQNLLQLNADENKLQRVLVNLLGNAIKFTPSGGTVTVRVRKTLKSKFVEFSVRDTGEGIPPEAFGRIFEKFGQVESKQSGRTPSTGLGLTFSKLAVEAHGGHIEVKSDRGQGSTFSFTIPI